MVKPLYIRRTERWSRRRHGTSGLRRRSPGAPAAAHSACIAPEHGGQSPWHFIWIIRLKPWGIRQRVLFVALAPAAAIALALAGYFLLLRYVDLETAMANRGSAMARQFVPAAEYGIFSGNPDELRRLAESLAQQPDVESVVIHDHSGNVLAEVGQARLRAPPLSLPDGWSGQTNDGQRLGFHAKITRPRMALDDATGPPPATLAAEPMGSVSVEISRAGVLARKREIMLVTLAVMLTVLALGALLAHRLAQDVTQPILSLQQAVERIRGGRLETRVAAHRGQTLRLLEDGINDMAAAMQSARDDLQGRIREATAELKEQKEQAERANMAKSRFLAAASHDLRQPLHALTLFAADLEQGAATKPQRRLAGQIATAAGALGEMLDGLLDLSRLDIGSDTVRHEPIALDALIRRVASSHSHSARAKGLKLRGIPTRAWTYSDPRLLERMLGNLVANAVRYTASGSILFGVRRAGDDLRLEVRDSGIGISTEHHELVFQEFYQVANPERDPGKGTGLGLALVSRMAHLLGHPLRLRSEPGRGSTFSIVLPRCPSALMQRAEENPAAIGGFDAQVQLFAPPSAAADHLRRLLESWGCNVHCVETRAAAAPSQPPDLVVCLDECCCEAIAYAQEDCVDLPPLILIGDMPPALENAARQNVLHLNKPIRPAKLRALLQHLLQSEFADSHPGA